MTLARSWTASHRTDTVDPHDLALALLVQLGPRAGWFVGAAADMLDVTPSERDRLLALAEEIRKIDGHDWAFSEEEKDGVRRKQAYLYDGEVVTSADWTLSLVLAVGMIPWVALAWWLFS
jgi:hypothetical protein